MRSESRSTRSARFAAPIADWLLRSCAIPVAALALLAVPAAAQWEKQSPAPTGLDVRGVGVPAPDHVFIATSDDFFDASGALFESADGGASWVQRDVPFSLGDPLNGIFFLDGLNGWTFGNANYRTTDGGTTWAELPFLGSAYFMEFYNTSFGLTTGNFGSYFSTDGGLNWEASPEELTRCDFADALNGLGVSATRIYRTADGGATFAPVFGDTATVARAAVYLSPSVAVGIVDDAFVRSTDGGATWTAGVAAEGRTGLVAVAADVALAHGRSGTFPDYDDRLFRTTDGGQTWIDLGQVMNDRAFAFATPGMNVVAADFGGDLFLSTDAGASWTQTFASPGPTTSFFSSAAPAFADAQTGYYGYGAGFVIKTTDGGTSWSQISSGTGQTLNDIDRFPNGDLIAVGENGTLLTNVGGTSPWALHEVLTSYPLAAVHVIGAGQVATVDESGQVFLSTDGGASWTAAAAKPNGLSPAEDVDFNTLLDGWVVGQGFGPGVAFHTTDGGATWTPNTGFVGAYVAGDFEGTNGWVANVGGRFYRTIDEGVSWSQGDLPGSPFQISDMDFFDVSLGYAVGWGGYAARSDDGGMSWQILPTPNTTDQFTDIHLIGPNELWVSTNSDAAYYSATGGQNWAVLDVGSLGLGNFSAIVGSPSGDAWTVGFQGYIEHFAGPPPPPLNRPPAASFDYATTGLAVDFTDLSSDPDGVIVSWAWDFGDSTFSVEQNPSHTFDVEGTYIVRLTVTDDDGDLGSTVRFITVQPLPGGTFGDFTEVTPLDPLFVTPQNEDFWVATTAPADYDGDGDLDIAVLGFYVIYSTSVEEKLVLFRNDGQLGPGQWDFAYIDVPLGTLSSGASDMAWGDVDGDGDQDLAVGTDGQTVIYRNDAGTLAMTDTVLPPYWEDNDQADFDLNSISWVDYDNDGDLDLLLPSVFNDSTFTFETRLMQNGGANGTGGWNFSDAGAGLADTRHAQTEWADFDGDQDMDLLLVHLAPLFGDGFIRRYRNDGGGVFVAEDVLGTLTVEHGEAHWGDYDADGDLDILVAGNIRETDGTYVDALRVYRNDAETYVPIDVIPCIPCDGWFDLTAAAWADYDSDGDVDILLCGTYNSGSQIEGRARIYANDGGVFTESGTDLPAPRASGSRGGTFSWLDLDGDGDLDYFIAGEYFVPGGNGLVEAQMHAYRNDAPGQNQAPKTPLGLSAVVDGGSVVLSWTPTTDDHTPTGALTYDLQVYRNGVPVVSPHRLPEPGNISTAANWLLAGLPEGAYAWTVRAVDSAYHGGLAAQGTFSLGAVTVALNGAPLEYAFGRSFPNPFTTSTTFRFALPEQAHTDLVVYDVSGRLVTRILDEMQPAGIHEVRWDAGRVTSGTYFVRLTSGSFTRTQRVVLLR